MSLISSNHFTQALSYANTALTVALNQGKSVVDAVKDAIPEVIQAIVNAESSAFAIAASKTNLLANTVIMDGTLTLRDNMVIMASAIVIKDAVSLKRDLEIGLSDDELNESILTIWKASGIETQERIKRSGGVAGDPNDPCGGACSI
jgi:hydroxymethylpyrimidine/phosphomethylpyrimidine kinase